MNIDLNDSELVMDSTIWYRILVLTPNQVHFQVEKFWLLVLTGLVAEASDDRVIVESMCKVSKRNIEFVDGCESCELEQLLLECSNESFDASVALRTPDE